MISDPEEFGAIVSQLYDALVDPAGWEQGIASMTRALGSTGCYLLIVDPSRSRVIKGLGYNMSPDSMREYETETASFCPRIAYANRVPDFGIMYDHLHTSDAEMPRDPFYNWIGGHGLQYYMNIQAIKRPDMLGALAFQRTSKQGHVTKSEINLAKKFMPHVRRVMGAQALLQDLELKQAAAEFAIDAMRIGMLFINFDGTIAHMNKAAASILADDDGLCTRGGKLAARKVDDDNNIRRAIGSSCEKVRTDHIGGTLTIAKNSDARPFQLLVCPLPHENLLLGGQSPAVIVFLVDPERLPSDTAAKLAKLYGFTRAEAEMAQDLIAGFSISDYSERHRLSMNTARWRLKQLQNKTETQSQMQMMRVLMNGIVQIVDSSFE